MQELIISLLAWPLYFYIVERSIKLGSHFHDQRLTLPISLAFFAMLMSTVVQNQLLLLVAFTGALSSWFIPLYFGPYFRNKIADIIAQQTIVFIFIGALLQLGILGFAAALVSAVFFGLLHLVHRFKPSKSDTWLIFFAAGLLGGAAFSVNFVIFGSFGLLANFALHGLFYFGLTKARIRKLSPAA